MSDITNMSDDALRRREASAMARRDANRPLSEEAARWQREAEHCRAELKTRREQRRAAANVARFVNGFGR